MPTKIQKLYAYLSLALVVLAWGVSPVVSKFVLTTYSPGIKRLMDALFASLALGAIAGKHFLTTDRSTVRFFPAGGYLFCPRHAL